MYYEIQRDDTFLTLAEEGYKKAIRLSQNDDFIALCYHNLANTIDYRFKRSRSRKDLEQKIRYREQSIEKTSEDSNQLAARICSLCMDEIDLYQINKDAKLLDKAITRLKSVTKMVLSTPIEKAGVWYNLARALLTRYTHSSKINDREEALLLLSKSTNEVEKFSNSLYLTSASTWASWAQRLEDWEEASIAFDHALNAADKIVEVQAGNIDQANRIEKIGDLHIHACHSFFQTGNYIESVMALERGRTRLLNHNLSLQSRQLKALAITNPSLADHAVKVTKEIRRFNNLNFGELGNINTSRISKELNSANDEWTRITSEIRKIEGYEYFGFQPNYQDIVSLASIKPIVYIVPAFWCGLVLIVLPSGNIEKITLPNLTPKKIQKLFQRSMILSVQEGRPLSGTDHICNWLWLNAMEPLITTLESMEISEIFVVSIGILAVLPLHAAWTTDSSKPSGRLYALDKLTISYIPSARSVVETLPATNQPIKSITIIEDPLSDLPYAVEESRHVVQYFSDVNLLGGEAATKDQVIKHISNRNILHFSCHGFVKAHDPMNSGLCMAFNEYLLVSDVYRIDTENTRLVVLSACETGLVGYHLLDEAIGFPTAWIGLGVPCVLSTLWSVDDKSTSYLMKLFYENIMVKNLRPDQALKKSQIQLRDSSFPDSDFSHPFYWGAFFITGY